MNKMKLIVLALFLFLSIFLFSGCAMRQPPGGGPQDKTPPSVIRTFPLPDSLNIAPDLDHIEIVFSERMNQESLTNNLFISPPLEYESNWEDWDDVVLLFDDSLQADRTYVISVASGMEDLHKNKMAESFQFAFSTGSQMDRNKIQGRIFTDETSRTFNLFAYELSDSLGFNPFNRKPDYISMTGNDGTFELNFMKNGQFRILAVDDMNGNLRLDAATEAFGIASRDVRLAGNSSDIRHLDFRITSMDTTAPVVQMVRPVNHSYLQLRFSEPVLLPESISIRDSLSNDTLPVLQQLANAEFKNIVDIFTAVQDSNRTYRVEIPAVQDSVGNRTDSSNALFFKGLATTDTTTFRLKTFLPKDSSKNLSPGTAVCLQFSKPVARASIVQAFHILRKDSSEVNGSWHFRSAYEICFKPLSLLQPDSSYRAGLDMGRVRDIWGKPLADSLVSHYFTIVSSRELGSVSGRVLGSDSLELPVYVQCRPIGKRSWRTVQAKKNGAFQFVNLPEGKYEFRVFVDTDRNGSYSYGRLLPFRFAEPFRMQSDTIKVRKRWESSDVGLTLPEKGQ